MHSNVVLSLGHLPPSLILSITMSCQTFRASEVSILTFIFSRPPEDVIPSITLYLKGPFLPQSISGTLSRNHLELRLRGDASVWLQGQGCGDEGMLCQVDF